MHKFTQRLQDQMTEKEMGEGGGHLHDTPHLCRNHRCLRSAEDENSAQQQRLEAEKIQKVVKEARKKRETGEIRKQKVVKEARKQKVVEEALQAEFDAQQREFEQVMIPLLRERCKKYHSWTRPQVERCLSFAEDALEYNPLIFDPVGWNSDASNTFLIDVDVDSNPDFALPWKVILLACALFSACIWRNLWRIKQSFSKKKRVKLYYSKVASIFPC